MYISVSIAPALSLPNLRPIKNIAQFLETITDKSWILNIVTPHEIYLSVFVAPIIKIATSVHGKRDQFFRNKAIYKIIILNALYRE